MKPDWKDAPEWAQYVAMDSNRVWYWYEKEPLQKRSYWEISNGLSQEILKFVDWTKTLEKRLGQTIVSEPISHDELDL